MGTLWAYRDGKTLIRRQSAENVSVIFLICSSVWFQSALSKNFISLIMTLNHLQFCFASATDGKRGKSTFSLFMAPTLRLGFLSTTFFKSIKIQHEELGLYLTYCLGPNCICSEVAQSPVLLAFPNVESGFTPQLTVYEGLCHPFSTACPLKRQKIFWYTLCPQTNPGTCCTNNHKRLCSLLK